MTSCNAVSSATESEKPKPCSCKCRKVVAAVVLVILLAGIACWYIHHPNRPRHVDPKPGTVCTIKYSLIDGVVETYTGTLLAANHEAILLDVNPVLVWIPKNRIVIIHIQKP